MYIRNLAQENSKHEILKTKLFLGRFRVNDVKIGGTPTNTNPYYTMNNKCHYQNQHVLKPLELIFQEQDF